MDTAYNRQEQQLTVNQFCPNPLGDSGQREIPNSCILVIFGASGDLTGKKLLPALFNLMRDGRLPLHFACVGVARREKSREAFCKEMQKCIEKYSAIKPLQNELSAFMEKLHYYQGDFQSDDLYRSFHDFLEELDKKNNTKGNRLFYLSTPPPFFAPIVEKLKKHHFLYDTSESKGRFSRVVIEKPFGHDSKSAIELQNELSKNLAENQIYRIDHYLGKETVQNLLVFRFSNSLFEGLWNNRYIDNIQISVAETIGIEGRGNFYEGEGLLRDIVQNHLMQLLSLVAMEPPINLSADAIRDEKVKVLQALQRFNEEQIENWAVRGQYKEGFINGEPVVAYRAETNVSKTSNVETFAALRLQVENWRWAGVPIYIRAGKRLPKRSTEIVVTFKKTPNILFQKNDKSNVPNQVIFRIQPNEGIALKFNSKVPGSANIIQPVNMDFQYSNYFGQAVPEAYERLIYDAILGDSTLFARVDESLNSWDFLTPILDFWASHPLDEEDLYPAGTWGPTSVDYLLKSEHRTWKPL